MIFTIVTFAAFMALLGALSFRRFKLNSVGKTDASANQSPLSAYTTWIASKARETSGGAIVRKSGDVLRAWILANYPGWTKWIFIIFMASTIILAASGFFFAIFIRRGLFGFPLLGHVTVGGPFAFSLVALLFWRGRAYRPRSGEDSARSSPASRIFKNISLAHARKVLFWAVAAFGLIQVLTALGSMLPVFTFGTQVALLAIHRYSALAFLLTTIGFVDLTFIPQPRP